MVFNYAHMNPFTCKREYSANMHSVRDFSRLFTKFTTLLGHNDGHSVTAFVNALPYLAQSLPRECPVDAFRTYTDYFGFGGGGAASATAFVSALPSFAPGFLAKVAEDMGSLRGALTIIDHDGLVSCYVYCGVGDEIRLPTIDVFATCTGTSAPFMANLLRSIETLTPTVIILDRDKKFAAASQADDEEYFAAVRVVVTKEEAKED